MRIGLTGGVGSGTTQAAKWLEAKGFFVLSGDEAGHRALTIPEIKNSLRERFGQRVFTDQGEVDRPRLGEIIFGDEKAREELNRIVHPTLLDILTREARRVEAQSGVVVVDAALIYEWGLAGFFHRIIVVDAPLDVRILRLRARDGLSEEQARQRIAAQWPLERKVEQADYVVNNVGSLDELHWLMDEVWRKIEQTAI